MEKVSQIWEEDSLDSDGYWNRVEASWLESETLQGGNWKYVYLASPNAKVYLWQSKIQLGWDSGPYLKRQSWKSRGGHSS